MGWWLDNTLKTQRQMEWSFLEKFKIFGAKPTQFLILGKS